MIYDSLLIDNYQPTYFDQLIRLLRLNTPHYFAAQEEADFIRYLKSELEDYFVVFIQDEIVACGGINYDLANNLAIISWDIVHPKYHGKSIGKRLLAYRINNIRSNKSVSKIIVRTSQHTFGFYEKVGFKLKLIDEDFWAEGIDLYQMEILLSND